MRHGESRTGVLCFTWWRLHKFVLEIQAARREALEQNQAADGGQRLAGGSGPVTLDDSQIARRLAAAEREAIRRLERHEAACPICADASGQPRVSGQSV